MKNQFPKGITITQENLSISQIREKHSQSNCVCPYYSRFNRHTGTLTGKSMVKISINEDTLKKYFHDAGYPYEKTSTNRTHHSVPHYAPINPQIAKIFTNTVTNALQSLVKQHFPTATGTYFIFDEETPYCHIFFNSTTENPTPAQPVHHQHQKDKVPSQPSNEEQIKHLRLQKATQLDEHRRLLLRQGLLASQQEDEDKKYQREKHRKQRQQQRQRMRHRQQKDDGLAL